MEHLLSPSGAGPISIPYVGGRVFEADTTPSTDILYYLKSYWDRAGWQRHPVTGDLSFRNRSPLEIVQSLQTSLYFGPLLSIFSRVGVHISTRDFLETSPTGQEIFVHTTNLPRFIAEWAKREGFSNGPPVSTGFTPKYMRGENIKEMLSWALYYLQTFFTQESKAMVEPYKSHMQLVELSIMAMGESLCSVLCAIYGYSMGDMATWGPSPILRARLRQNGWCTSDSPFFPESMASVSISADYYFGSFPCPRQRGDHSECTAAICNEYCKKIKADEYEQKHVSSNCSCKAVEIPDEAIHLVARKQIPTVLWDGLEMKVSIGSILNPYVAVSHV